MCSLPALLLMAVGGFGGGSVTGIAGRRFAAHAIHLHEAQPARTDGRQIFVIAQRRDGEAMCACSLEDGLALARFDEVIVDGEMDGHRLCLGFNM